MLFFGGGGEGNKFTFIILNAYTSCFNSILQVMRITFINSVKASYFMLKYSSIPFILKKLDT